MGFIISINGHFVTVSKNVTILQACEFVGCFIPRFCYQPILNIAGNCRMCLVSVYGVGKPVVSCTVFVSVGIVIYTTSFFVNKAREGVLEFLLLNHPLDCPVCDQGGMCDLQEQRFLFGSDRSRFFGLKRSVSNEYLGPVIKTVINRCILCTRCVRFFSEVRGSFWERRPRLITAGRGSYRKISTYLVLPIINNLSGNAIDLCPVGALTKKPYAFIGRPWERQNIVSYDLSCRTINKVYFSTLIGDSYFIRVNSMRGSWISNQTRFSYDAFNFIPFISVMPESFKMPSTETVFLGSDLSLLDLIAISFYFDSLKFGSKIFSRIPVIDRTRPCFWGGGKRIRSLVSFDFILFVGVGFSDVAPSLFASAREAFCSGSFIFRFGSSERGSSMVTFCGNRLRDFIRFVLGYHQCCLFFSSVSKSIVFFSTSLFSREYSSLWISLVDKLYSFGFVVSFINNYVNEVAYSFSNVLVGVKSTRSFLKKHEVVSIFGYLSAFYIEYLWVNSVIIDFFCGCWPIGLRSYQTLPLCFQRTLVCTPTGQVGSVNPLLVGSSSFSFDCSIKDVLLLASGINYWSVPLFVDSNIFVLRSTRIEPLDFYIKSIIFNCLIQLPVNWTSLVSWVEHSHVCRQFQLYKECVEFNF